MSKAFLIVGATGTGKSTFLKNQLLRFPKSAIFLYDVNNEYDAFVPDDYELPEFGKFADKASKIENGVIVFEEATIFLSNTGSNQQLRDILVKKRHKRNTIFLVFHSLRAIPRYVYDLCNHVVLFHTNDSQRFIDSRFEHEKLSIGFKRVNERYLKKKHYHEIIDIY